MAVLDLLDGLLGSARIRDVADFRAALAAFDFGHVVRSSTCLCRGNLPNTDILPDRAQACITPLRSGQFGNEVSAPRMMSIWHAKQRNAEDPATATVSPRATAPACKVHDDCYTAHGLTPGSNRDPSLPSFKEEQLQQCNQQLCNAAQANPSASGSTLIPFYFGRVLKGACESQPQKDQYLTRYWG